MNENKMVGKLKISTKPGCENHACLMPRDLDITLDGEKLPPIYKLNLIVEPPDCVRIEIGFYPSEVDVDAQVLAAFGLVIEKPTT